MPEALCCVPIETCKNLLKNLLILLPALQWLPSAPMLFGKNLLRDRALREGILTGSQLLPSGFFKLRSVLAEVLKPNLAFGIKHPIV
jgi:hypothetical protein